MLFFSLLSQCSTRLLFNGSLSNHLQSCVPLERYHPREFNVKISEVFTFSQPIQGELFYSIKCKACNKACGDVLGAGVGVGVGVFLGLPEK